jgi:hypothetical protein
MSAGHPLTDIIIRQQDIMSLSYNDMFISQRGSPWPDTNIMQMVKYNCTVDAAFWAVQHQVAILGWLC